MFHHACKIGLEGIVSKRKDSTYRSGRSPDWLKMKNPACEAVRREAEEDWGMKPCLALLLFSFLGRDVHPREHDQEN